MIKSSNIFWGGVLIVLGGLFLVDSLGILDINLGHIFWPLMLILLGGWVLMGYFFRDHPVEGEVASIPLEEARKGALRIHHGAGRLVVGPGAEPMDLAAGIFGGGLRVRKHWEGDEVDVTLRVRDSGFPMIVFPWFWGAHNNLNWDIQLSDEIPLDLKLNTGASDTRLDLTDLQIENLRVETGASLTEIHLPDQVAYTKVVVKAGAASIKIFVPEGVAARIRTSGGLMGASIDRDRFPKTGGLHQSPDYDTAAHRAEIWVNIGAGSLTVS
ncbi:MAG: LiaF-related protein [Anaerolineales bacterium]|nr:LiaF-related protein [Anaerolineales bacterium]